MSSEVIDEKVVSLKFNNKQFEENASQSLSTIQKLKQALNFKDAQKSFEGLEKATKNIQLSGIGQSVDTIVQKFSGMEVAARAAITNITNSFVNSAKHWVSSVTIDPIKTGISTYEQKINSVQTILTNSGKDLKEVNRILDELNEYSDKTIFSLNDMTTALGKFTAAGIDASEAVDIIKGAANEAATMGAGSAEFSRFIYNLSQAYSVGKMTMIDWKSLENAGVAGKVFKQRLVDAAIELGTLDKEGKTLDKHLQVTAENLREYLKDGVVTSEVMTKVFKEYADNTTEFGKAANNAATQVKTFHQLMDVLAESVASTWSQSFGYIIGDFYEAKRLWTSVSNIFEATVGKMNENRNKLLKAWKEGFVDPAKNTKYTMQEVSDAISKGLPDPRAVSGRTLLLEGFANALNAILQFAKPIREAFRELFPKMTANTLWEMTKNFRDFTASLKLSEPALKEIKDAATGVFSIMKFGSDVIKDIIHALIPASTQVDSLAVLFIKIAGALGRFVTNTLNAIRSSETYRDILESITYYAKLFLNVIGIVVGNLAHFLKMAKDSGAAKAAFQGIGTALNVLLNTLLHIVPAAITVFKVIAMGVGGLMLLIGNAISAVSEFFGKIFGKDTNTKKLGENIDAGLAEGLNSGSDVVAKAMHNVTGTLEQTFRKDTQTHSPSLLFVALGGFLIAGLVLGIARSAGLLSEGENVILDFLGNIVTGIGDSVKKIKEYLFDANGAGETIITHMGNVEETVTEKSVGLLDKIGNALRGFTQHLKNFNLGAVVVIGVIATLMFVVAKFVGSIFNLSNALSNGLKAANRVAKSFQNMSAAFRRIHSPLAESLKGITLCILGVAASIWLLSTLKDQGKLAPALASLIITFTLVLGVIVGAAALAKKFELTDDIEKLAIMIVAISGSFILMSLAFSNMINALKSVHKKVGLVVSAIGIIVVIAGLLVGVMTVLSKLDTKGSVQAMLSILIFSFSLQKVIDAMGNLISSASELKDKDTGKIWTAGVLPVLILMLGVAAMGVAFQHTGVGSALTVLAMIFAINKIVEAIAKVDWDSFAGKVKEMHNTIVIAIMGLVVAITIMALAGEGLNNFAKGLMGIVGAIAGMVLVCNVIKKLQLSEDAINQGIKIAKAIGLLAAALIVVIHFFDVPVGKFTGFSMMLLALCGVMLAMAKVSDILASAGSGFHQGITAFETVAKVLTKMMLTIAVVIAVMKICKDVKPNQLTGPIIGLGLVVLALSTVIKAAEKTDLGKLESIFNIILVIMGGLAVITLMLGDIKPKTTGPVVALVGALLVIFGSLILLTLVPFEKLMYATASIATCMLGIAAILGMMSQFKKGAKVVGPMITIIAAMVVVAGSLILLSQYSWEQLSSSMLAMMGVMLTMTLVLKAMKGVNDKVIGATLVAIIAILAIAASLSLLSYFQWDAIMDAAFAMAVVLAAVSGCLYLMSQAGKGGSMAVAAASILIVAGSLIVMAGALKVIEGINPQIITSVCGALIVMALCIALLGTLRSSAAVGASALLIASVAIVVITGALMFLAQIADSNGTLGKCVGTLVIVLVVLGAITAILGLLAESGIGILGAAALVAASIGLIVIAKAMQMFSSVPDGRGGGWLAGLAGALMLVAIAGVLLIAGAPGLNAAAPGLILIALAMQQFGKVKKSVTGARLVGIAGGLMLMGIAGVILGLGAMGLISSGAGLILIGTALQRFNSIKIGGDELSAIGESLMSYAKAGIVGIVGGPGLILLSVGIIAMAGALKTLVSVVDKVLKMDLGKVANDSVDMGGFIVGGLAEGIQNGFGFIGKVVGGLAGIVENTFRNIMGIHSNSDMFIDFGKFILGGLAEGLTDEDWNQGIGHIMRKVADNVVGNFTDQLGFDLKSVDDVLKKFSLKVPKTVYKMVSEHGGANGGPLYAWVTEMVDMFSFENGIFGNLTDGLSGLWDPDQFNGMKDLDKYLGGNVLDMSEYEQAAKGATVSTGDFSNAVDGTAGSTKDLNKSMSDSLSVFEEYERKLDKTTKEIHKNLIDNMIGQEKFETDINNLIASGVYDYRIIQDLENKGYEQGSAYAAALLMAIEDSSNPNYAKELNDWYLATLENSLGAQNKANLELLASGKKLEDMNVKQIKSVQYLGAEYVKVNPTGSVSKWADSSNKALTSYLVGLENTSEESAKYLKKQKAEAEKYAAEGANAEAIEQAIAGIGTALENAFKYYMPSERFVQIGENICKGVASGIFGYADVTTRAVQANATDMVRAFEKALGIESPSKVFRGLGDYVMQGLAKGIENNNDPEKSTKSVAENMKTQLQMIFDQILAVMNSDDEWQPTIRPVVDFSNITSGANSVQKLFDGTQVSLAGTEFSNYKTSLQTPQANVMSMTKSEFQEFLAGFANTIVDGVTAEDRNVEVNVNLQGDAKGLFKVVREENNRFKRTAGYSALG